VSTGSDLATRAELFGSVFVLVGHLTTRMDRELRELDLTTRQWLLLAVLDRLGRERPPTLTEAAAAYGSSRQNVKAIAEGLAARGWLHIQRDARDRRAVRLTLTDRIDVFHQPDQERRAADLLGEVYAGLPPSDVADLHRLVTEWLGALAGRDHAPALVIKE